MSAPPSPFAALLRRSKFVTYDPSIGQVYTTHNGHAFRGDWGFKRPLPNRRRSGFITVRSVDSPEQQTEWKSGESSARWMRRWEELGKKLEIEEMGPWRSRIGTGTWKLDTEFSRAGKSTDSLDDPNDFENPDTFINPEAMSPKQFQKYLDRLRTLRPEFKQYLKGYWLELQKRQQGTGSRQLASQKGQFMLTGSGDVHMLHSAQTAPDRVVYDFLKLKANQELDSPLSTRIEQRPHPLAGLEYTWMSTLQAKYLHKPVPGRNIGSNRGSAYEHGDRQDKFHLIAAGGVVGQIDTGMHNIVPTDFGTQESPRMNRERGKGVFRMSKIILVDPPQTVGRLPQTATDTKLTQIKFRVAQSSNHSNPHPLGSSEYVSQTDSVSHAGPDHHPVPSSVTKLTRGVKYDREVNSNAEKIAAEILLRKLAHMINT